MNTLVWVEHDNASVKDATLSAVTAAAKLGEVHLLVAGAGIGGVAEAAAKVAGVAKVVTFDDAAFKHALPENVAPAVADLMRGYDAFVAPSTSNGKNIAPRVAALLDVMQVSDILSVESADTFTRPIYAGNAIATVQSSDAKKVITVRGTAFEKAAREGGSASIEAATGTDAGLSSFVGAEIAQSERPELTSAKIIVSGGRALGSAGQFHGVIDPLADKLDAVLPQTAVAQADAWKFAASAFADSARGLSHIPPLRAAIKARQKLRITYTSREGTVTSRTIRPLHLEYWSRIWTLTAWCEWRSAHRVFRLDLINTAEALPELFNDEPGKALADYTP